DLTPVKSLAKIGGVGIELWTMTEDILFDNIYVGHSVDDAKTLASETFDIKKTLEKAKKAAEVDDDDEEESFSEDPIGFIRSRILTFIDILKLDPLLAFKTHPETGVALVTALLTLFGMFGVVTGVVGSQQKPVTKSTKKTDAPKATEKKTDAAPAGDEKEEKKDEGLKKRTGK
ncbi:hypothetical protein EV361DRAFT_943824, partial [Lentinula raphanica]